MAKHARKVDANQEAVVEALRKIGASVAITSEIGGGFPDLVVGYHGLNFLLEVKDGTKPVTQRKLTPEQMKFLGRWRGQYDVVNTPGAAVQLVTEATCYKLQEGK